MKPAQVRIGDLWCRLMHTEPMWPSHGQYQCRTCWRSRPVCWEQPSPATLRVAELARQTQARSAVAVELLSIGRIGEAAFQTYPLLQPRGGTIVGGSNSALAGAGVRVLLPLT